MIGRHRPTLKRSEHRTFPGEISRAEMMRVFDGDEAWVRTLEETISHLQCACEASHRYKVFVNDLNDGDAGHL